MRIIQTALFIMLGMLLGVLLAGRETERQILAARQQSQQCLAQLASLKARSAAFRQAQDTAGGADPGTNPVIAGIISGVLGIPPEVAALALPLAEQAMNEVDRNLQRSEELQGKLRAAGEDSAIRMLLTADRPEWCGSRTDAECRLAQMCENPPDEELTARAEACGQDRECWRGILESCGAFHPEPVK